MIPSRPPLANSRLAGSALVSTLLVIVVLTIIVVAFLQSMTVERQTARSYLNRYRAELAAKAALAEALGRLESATADSRFHYSVETEKPNTTDEYLKLTPKVIDTVDVDTGRETALSVVPNEPDTEGTTLIDISPVGYSPSIKRATAWKRLVNSNEEIGRYSFATEEAAGKLDLFVHSGVGNRGQMEDLREIPLIEASGTPFSEEDAVKLQDYQTFTKVSDRLELPTVATINQIISPSPEANEGDFTFDSSTAILTPTGKPRLNLARLKVYLDGGTYQERDENKLDDPGYKPVTYFRLSLAQGADTATNKRFELVTRLLNEDGQHGAEKQNPWGQGNLEIVKEIFPPVGGNLTQARQFVANLIDYIDDDLIPTTDGGPGPAPTSGQATDSQIITATLPPPPPAPTFLGVEARYVVDPVDSTKNGIVGHPYITYVGQGFIFNLGGAGGNSINSSRVLGWVGMAYPWDRSATWTFGSAGGYQVEMQVTLDGTVSGTRGLGVMATAPNNGYFAPNWLAQKSGYFLPPVKDQVERPTELGKAHSYFIYPRPAANNFDLGNGYFNINQVISQLRFINLSTTIQTLRVIYKVPGEVGGPRFLVQDLRALSALPRAWAPANFSPNRQQYKLGGTYGQMDWHFSGDPRLNFKIDGWRLAATTGSNLIQGTGAVKATTGETNVYSAAPNDRKDPLQDLKSDALEWFKEGKGLANHFMVKDSARSVNPVPSPDLNQPPMKSYAELGFIHAGKPWQTLTLFYDPLRFPDQNAIDKADWKLLDYVDIGVLPRHRNSDNQREVIGQINVNTSHRNTLKALFTDITTVPESKPLVDLLLSSDKRPFLTPSSIFALEELKNTGTTDPEREDLAGRIYPALATHSQKFLIQCVGEARQNERTVSRVHLVAEVELRPTPDLAAGGTLKLTPTVLKTHYR